jgi:cyclophilin family peptidyl-prolyl cis-trans isomerase
LIDKMRFKKLNSIVISALITSSLVSCSWFESEEETELKIEDKDDVKVVYKSKYDSPKLPILEQGLEESLKDIDVPSVSDSLNSRKQTSNDVENELPKIGDGQDNVTKALEKELVEFDSRTNEDELDQKREAFKDDINVAYNQKAEEQEKIVENFEEVAKISQNEIEYLNDENKELRTYPQVKISRITLDEYNNQARDYQDIKELEKDNNEQVINRVQDSFAQDYIISEEEYLREQKTREIKLSQMSNQTNNSAFSLNDFSSDELPTDSAAIGQCYAKMKIGATYKDVQQKVMVEEAKTKIEVIPAKYDYVNKEVVVREETVKYVEIPATYKKVTERVVIEPEKRKVVTIPAKYNNISQKVLIEPAKKVWKKERKVLPGSNSVEEVMRLVEQPAQYETVTKRVMVEPERSETRIIPAVTEMITREVIDQPARVVRKVVPAVTKNIRQKVLASPQREVEVKIPAKYKTVNKRIPITPAKTKWEAVLCDSDLDKRLVYNIQKSLSDRGYSVGDVDGILGNRTISAIQKFQKTLGFEINGIALRTLRALNIR